MAMSSGVVEIAGPSTVDGVALDSLRAFEDWIDQGQWRDRFEQSMTQFAITFQVSSSLPLRETVDKLATRDYNTFAIFLLERFLCEAYDGPSPVEDFLASSGARVSERLAGYLRGVESSSRSVYEVVSLGRRASAVLKDSLGEDSPEFEVEIQKSQEFVPGSFILGRVVRIGDRLALTNATIEVPPSIVSVISPGQGKVSRIFGENGKPLAELDSEAKEQAWDIAFSAWILHRVIEITGLGSRLVREIEHELGPLPLAFPLRGSRSEVSAILNRSGEFRKCCDSGWKWVPDFRQRNPMIKATVHFAEDYLVVGADSNNQLKAIKGRLLSVLGRKIGKPIPADEDFFDSIDHKADQAVEAKAAPAIPQPQIVTIPVPRTKELSRPRQLELHFDLM